MFEPPTHAVVHQLPTSTMWFDADGILWSVTKKAPPQTLEEARKSLEEFRALTGGKKVCMLIDVTHTNETTRELRDFAAEELPKFTKAIAMVSDSALGKMFANIFFKLKSQPYPVRMFNNAIEAKAWLMKHR